MTRRYHFNFPSLIYILLTLLVGIAAANSQNNLLFWIFGMLLAAFLINGAISGMMMRNLRVRRLDIPEGSVGAPMFVGYAITNRSRFLPAFNIHIEELPGGRHANWPTFTQRGTGWAMHIGPRETVHGEAIFTPRRRGEVRFDRVRLWTTFPMGLVRRSVTIRQPQHTYLYPQVYELSRRVFTTVTTHATTGSRISSRPGMGDDYFGLREYRPGDSLRHIAWKRTARTDEIVSIERSHPSPPRLRIILNLQRSTEDLVGKALTLEEARQQEEQAISLAASLARQAEHGGFQVGLVVLGGETPPIPLRSGTRHNRRILAALAAIDLDAHRTTRTVTTPPDTERAAMVVIHPDRVEPSIGRHDAWHLSARQMEQLVVRATTVQSTYGPTAELPVRESGTAPETAA
jgi:uncharacterized protein (DUF58 family)